MRPYIDTLYTCRGTWSRSWTVFPTLNPFYLTVHLPEIMPQSLNFTGIVINDGVKIEGTDMMYNYKQILRQVPYDNLKPA